MSSKFPFTLPTLKKNKPVIFKALNLYFMSKISASVFFISLVSLPIRAQEVFKSNSDQLAIYVNKKLIVKEWSINPDVKIDVFKAECSKKNNLVEFTDGINKISFKIKRNETIEFIILNKNNQKANTRIIGIEPNLNFNKKYIKEYQGLTKVEIPEVSELVNIIMVLHKDAEKENNMFDTKSEYYKHVKEYFRPFNNHPILDTIHKYITGLKLDNEKYFFSDESYMYYYEMKMNACNYNFDRKGKIVNNKIIKEMAGLHSFDPFKDLELINDFAAKSNFKKFYNDNKPYYDELIKTYNQLNPIQRMQTWLDSKFGLGYGSYVVYFSPLVQGAHSAQKFEDNGFKQSFMFIAKSELNTSISPIMNEISSGRVVFTEIDHNYVNPASDKKVKIINEVFKDMTLWVKGQSATFYNSPYMVFNEYMTWAVYTLYLYDNHFEKDLYNYLPEMENQMELRGFIRFKKFNRALLEKYKTNKKISIEELYDYILEESKQDM